MVQRLRVSINAITLARTTLQKLERKCGFVARVAEFAITIGVHIMHLDGAQLSLTLFKDQKSTCTQPAVSPLEPCGRRLDYGIRISKAILGFRVVASEMQSEPVHRHADQSDEGKRFVVRWCTQGEYIDTKLTLVTAWIHSRNTFNYV